jgi:hypothetical protein
MSIEGFTFAAPAQGDLWKAADHIGSLLVIEVEGYETGISTSYGEDADAVRATVHDISLADTSEQALIFTGSLISALKPRVGSKVLAVLQQGVAKPGKNPPYLLADATGDPASVQKATAYLNARQQGQYSPPAQPSGAASGLQPAAPQRPAPAGGVDVTDPTVQAALAALLKQQQGA